MQRFNSFLPRKFDVNFAVAFFVGLSHKSFALFDGTMLSNPTKNNDVSAIFIAFLAKTSTPHGKLC